ncbi:UDP-N-acetylmuramoyl-L-alanyl-D-glutamate--2,6-diaminopimelate ligase [Priestia taiwanensis]|uniref:UDP-N-acetylmuramoyl-L-alanyl-D-glutamate--2,6-diaminopimelate ligase n=1 Tax=Priestia taiwanensis TaxID=1347902 RepID=A0A917EQY9_9BACI|nr:UDP-N-acetylmuramoyl-L-alanyl-D-glutamate--2,6-diaminopimelate ligase [Priestia taiwanensis]GGE68479.1 UDP-N-acetylmuramoyl-L-alanyl-D-glutamate--2,6-diaminopimelate ligase [Priestia taiwanensis]
MRIQELASLLATATVVGDGHTKVTGIQMDSRKIQQGDLFVCIGGIDGFLEDRHQYAEVAVKAGAAGLVVERDVDVDVPKIFVRDARHALALFSAHVYNHPSKELGVIGITGTNGKTTTAYLLEKMMADGGFQTGIMGSIEMKIGKDVLPTDINTQEPPTLQRSLRKMVDVGTDYCMMEVTSQGLDMGRVKGVQFKTAVFTNLTQDHLDYHETFEAYRAAKGLFFSRLGNMFSEQTYAVLNADDSAWRYFAEQTIAEVITYGIHNEADVRATNIEVTAKGLRFDVSTFKGDATITMPMLGTFNIYNALGAIATALLEGISLQTIQQSLASVQPVRGRMEVVEAGQDFTVIVDYAHTPDALENTLSTIKEFATGKIITVFGCGGNRDKSKRPLMGRIAGLYSDEILITSDNPRDEDPLEILHNIEQGIEGEHLSYALIVDRKDAIEQALKQAQLGDVVVIAGKGHETYQLINGKTIHFDDREIVRHVLGK